MRFSNKTIWEKKRIKDFCEVNPKTEELEDEFIYIDLESVSKGCLLSKNIISKTNAPSRAQRVLKNNDILFQCVRPYQMNNLLFNAENADFQYVASTGYAQIRTQENSSFVYQLLHSPIFNKEVMLRCTGSSYPAISSSDLEDIEVYICGVEEQQKIGYFLDLIDRRIAVQNKIISKYETLIKGIRHRIFGSICGEKQSSLGGFLEEYSEKNVANNLQSVAVGKYGIRKREEIYSKELSADYSKNKVIRKNTLIIGMGSTQIDIGILTTDDCYCVSPAYTTYRIKGINSFYLQEYLIELNPLLSVRYMITSARQGKAVNKEDLMKHLMTIHSESEQKEICQCFENLYSRLQIEKEMLSALQKQKAFLLQSMFI